MIKFTDTGHVYQSVLPDGIQWRSVSGIVHQLIEPFDKNLTAAKCSRNSRSKWYGNNPEDIIAAWDSENKRSTTLGTWYHDQQEQWLYASGDSSVHLPVIIDGIKYAPIQVLAPGIYPEHMMYLQSAGICGQSDKVEVTTDSVVNITDHKTNKEIKTKGFENWEGVKKMLAPVSHLDDCEFSHYAIQLSMYAYMILRHNPGLKIGKLMIEHVKFEEVGTDKWGYPITKLNSIGEPIVKEVISIELPYLKAECITIIKHLKK